MQGGFNIWVFAGFMVSLRSVRKNGRLKEDSKGPSWWVGVGKAWNCKAFSHRGFCWIHGCSARDGRSGLIGEWQGLRALKMSHMSHA